VEISSTPFDQKILFDAREYCNRINQCLGKLLVLSSTLPRHFQDRLTNAVGILDNGTVGNIMCVLTIIESSLRTGAPLPERMPTPLVQSCFVTWFKNHGRLELKVDLMKGEDYRRYCVAISSYMTLLAMIDDLVDALKGVLGESHVVHNWEEAV
jgi:hypothetical protein